MWVLLAVFRLDKVLKQDKYLDPKKQNGKGGSLFVQPCLRGRAHMTSLSIQGGFEEDRGVQIDWRIG